MSDAPNASDRKSIRQQEKAARLAERDRAEVITSIMSTTFGRAWLWDILSRTHIFVTTHVAGDPLGSAFQEGQRSTGLSLLADVMQACPDQYIQAMREANVRHHSNDASSASADSPTERRGSTIPDGGDSGTSPDSSAADLEADDPSAEPRWNPGADIYAEPAGPAKAS